MPDIIEAQPYGKSDFILIGGDPLAVNEKGKPTNAVQTFFIGYKALITVPGTHADQRLLFIDYLNQERERVGQPKLTNCESEAIWDDSVSMAVLCDEETNKPFIGIRIDCNLSRAVRARDVLLQVFSKDQVRLF